MYLYNLLKKEKDCLPNKDIEQHYEHAVLVQ